MCWPARTECFGDAARLLRAKQAYARVARAISAFEPVKLAARRADAPEARLATAGKVEVVEMALDDAWARDFGPTCLKNANGRLAGVQWVFNAWGGKYGPYASDARFATTVLESVSVPAYSAPLICEGGALAGDGEGTVLTTEQCLLNANRNPGRTREEVEEVLKLYLGAERVVWLGDGFADDETDGHVDNIACFVSAGRVIVGVPANDHPDRAPVAEAMRRLRSARDAQGRALEIVELPQPQTQREDWRGRLLATSYVNFYLVDGGVVMPSFEDANDEAARAIVADCFPGRDIVQIDALDIVQGGGGIHCITQQEPMP